MIGVSRPRCCISWTPSILHGLAELTARLFLISLKVFKHRAQGQAGSRLHARAACALHAAGDPTTDLVAHVEGSDAVAQLGAARGVIHCLAFACPRAVGTFFLPTLAIAVGSAVPLHRRVVAALVLQQGVHAGALCGGGGHHQEQPCGEERRPHSAERTSRWGGAQVLELVANNPVLE
eukprot:CAMPEP_0179279776 /NCGR_PEP_ID=MMETSP0797-20121207/36289_1 /TAXON_ID=47934 /ORGANISM="Dinophysis acuminata, Strain DAEP01" /LENGTH=177 /DNA_ID=CAMNT_0020988417 /DNA_START=83 /DNA_END=613 /DNA_ORIENTATION=+